MAKPVVVLESVESLSPSTSGCSWGDGRAVATYQLGGLPAANPVPGAPIPMPLPGQVTPTIIQQAITQLIGDTSLTVSTKGNLTRSLPAAHPLYNYDFVSSIAEIQGTNGFTLSKLTQQQLKLEASAVSNFVALYNTYLFKCVFTPRNYAVLSDARVTNSPRGGAADKFWTGQFNGGNPVEQPYYWCNEWIRFADWEKIPQPESVTATQGNMIFRAGAAKNAVYAGMPRMYLKNSLIKWTWYQIPYRYVTSSNCYFDQMLGTINQTDIYKWPAGSLLYMGYSVKRYTPPVQKVLQVGNLPGTFTADKLCDIEFTFLHTARTSDDVFAVANPNWLVAGHNLLPFPKDRRFHYATTYDPTTPATAADQSKWIPSWLSAPHQLLWTDPDTAQPADLKPLLP